MNEELNKKLAEWRFPNADAIIVESGISVYHNERKEPDYPWHIDLLTQSLDACFKWLVPRLHFAEVHTSSSGFVSTLFYTENLCYYEGEAESPALALCLAIEKLIDGGTL